MTDLIATLAREARQYPDRIMLVDAAGAVTLGELWQRVSALGVAMQSAGVRPGERVALVGGNTPAWVQVWLASLAVGAVVVPLNPELRAADLAALISHAGARWAFVDLPGRRADDVRERLDGVGLLQRDGVTSEMCISLADLPPASTAMSVSAGGELAAILYTSGTTGAPKGVMLGHEGLLQNALDVIDYLSLDEGDVSLALLPFYYSFGNSILLTHLLAGARLVFGATLMYPEKMLALVDEHKVTGLYGVPGLFQLLLQRNLLADARWQSLRYVAQAGGPLSAPAADAIERSLPGTPVFIMYGQTEATARISYLSPEYRRLHPDSVGWPMPDTCIQIRDDQQQLLPSGEVGHVWVRGPGVMLGYWRNQQATAQVLVDGWLDTGDMGELDAGGFLYIRGRRSDMLKVSGQRLHPQEVEAVICEIADVSECAVDGVDDPLAGQVPRAFIVPRAGCEISPMAVLRYCREQLAAWKVPRHIEIVDALPKTGSGKIQRHLLADTINKPKQQSLSEGHA